jgi:flagellar biosynthesis protein FliQ
MSVAEYIAAFISIMIGLALADLATSLQRLLRAGKRVRWDLLTPAAAILVTAFIINVWWTMFAALNAMQSLTVAVFIPDLISLLLLFCLASSALPDEVGERLDLGAYYRDNRRPFWGLFALYTVWVTLVVGFRTVAAGAPLGAFLGNVVPNTVLAALMVTLALTGRRWVHVAVIALLLLTTAFAWLPQKLGGGAAPAVAARR